MTHMCRGSAVIENLRAFLNTRMRTAQPDSEETSVALVVSRVFRSQPERTWH